MTYLSHLTKFQGWLLGLCFAGLAFAQINQPFPAVAPLHHIPTLIVLLAAPALLKRYPISNPALVCLVAFLALHTLGGRYTYTNTPYDAWFASLFGSDLSTVMGWERNHYDRLVHFLFGVFAMPPMVEMGVRYWGMTKRLSWVFALTFVLALGGLYEIFEWSLTLALAPDAAGAYNGEQGDMFDAQKDMALAGLGALLMIPWVRKAVWWEE